jgi:hypothetical protein
VGATTIAFPDISTSIDRRPLPGAPEVRFVMFTEDANVTLTAALQT